MIMPYEYPVNWNGLILLYQGTTSRFIESKTLKIAIFQPKMAQKWPLMANIPKFFILIQYDYAYKYPVNWDALILLYQGTMSKFIE